MLVKIKIMQYDPSDFIGKEFEAIIDETKSCGYFLDEGNCFWYITGNQFEIVDKSKQQNNNNIYLQYIEDLRKVARLN